MVLVTGDGNDNHRNSSFPRLVAQLARLGFRFELWAWKRSRSRRHAEAVAAFPDGRVALRDLDDAADRVLFAAPARPAAGRKASGLSSPARADRMRGEGPAGSGAGAGDSGRVGDEAAPPTPPRAQQRLPLCPDTAAAGTGRGGRESGEEDELAAAIAASLRSFEEEQVWR